MTRSAVVFLCFVAFAVGCRNETSEERLREDNLLNQLADEYFSERVRFYPVEATLNGYREYDGELGDLSQEAIRDRIAWIHDFRQRLLGVDVTRVSRSGYIDLLLLTRAVKAELNTLESRELWRRSPLFYSKRIYKGFRSLLRDGSPSDTELQSLLSRLGQIPSFIEAARDNIERPSRLAVEDAISELRLSSARIADFSITLGKSSSPRKLEELGRISRESTQALERFIAFLESDLLPHATASFVLGSDELSRELLYEEMEDAPLDTVREIAEREMRGIRLRMEEIAARLGNSGGPGGILNDLASDHPPWSELVQTTENILLGIRRFTNERRLFEHSPESRLQIVATPPILQDHRSAFLVTPGSLERGDAPSYFMLTLPPEEGRAQQAEFHLRNLNTRALRLAVIREVHPGRFMSYTYQKDSMSRTRQILTSKATIDGWSHYVEQVLLDEGYEWDDPALELMQLHNALIEQSRLAVAIGLHTGQMSIVRATEIFRTEAFLDSGEATREARRVAGDWRRASAALGKLQIIKLRTDYIGDEPSRTVHSFHEELLAGVGLPLKLIRLLMIPEDQRPTLDYR